MEDRVVANIIYKELFSYNTVLMQDIGYISLVSYSASLSEDGSILRPPYKTIAVYSLEENFTQFVDLIAAISQALGTDYMTSSSLYNEFILNHRIDNILTIPMVMTINLDDMYIINLDENIVNALEGQDLQNIRLLPPPSSKVPSAPGRKYELSSEPGMFLMTFAILIIIVAVAYIVQYFYF